MIDRQRLLGDLQNVLKRLEADLLERSESAEVPEVGQTLQTDYDEAKAAQRTAQNYEDWRSDYTTQMAAAWVLSCVFVRFLEDNRLIDPAKIAGPGDRLQEARDEHELYFQEHPKKTDRDYLLAVFDELAELPGTKEVFSEHNPIRELPNWLSGDAGGELLRFFQKIDANTGLLIHDFTDPSWDTRFLGDLYQDLSESARKKYALLQTPEFVEEFILDRTLDLAIEEFGLEGFRMIDPACGSGHFLLGAFRRIEVRWEKHAPKAKGREVVQRALDSIFGVDVNPFAVAIARFRLLLASLRTCGVTKLAKSPAFQVNLACGDSLYHGRQQQQMLGDDWTDEAHYFAAEDAPTLRQMLRDGTYHCVVANPPYITPKDRAANEAYRKLYPKTCHMQYSLALPFMERIFRLALPSGFTGQITANSFMKREFGKKLIEQFLPTIDLTHAIDTSGAYIPGHGTPTVIVFGRNQKPSTATIRTVMGIRGEPSTPADPAQGLVWSAIVKQIDQPGSQSEFVSVGDSPRENFHRHPWSIGGGGAAELKIGIDQAAHIALSDFAKEIGFLVITGEDNCLLLPVGLVNRVGLKGVIPIGDGEAVRDWHCDSDQVVLWPNDSRGNRLSVHELTVHIDFLWPYRTSLKDRRAFSVPVEQKGIPWWALREVYTDKLRTPFSIVYAEVATHNHFVLDRGGKVFKQTAPVIKLQSDASEDEHLGLLGLLNSSTGCFWLKQVCQPKGSSGIGRGVYDEAWEKHFAFNSTKIGQFPLAKAFPLAITRRLDKLVSSLAANSPVNAIKRWQIQQGPELARGCSLRQCLDDARTASELIRGEMFMVQEDLDWQCYRVYGLIGEEVTVGLQPDDENRAIPPGNRAFEILMARQMAEGKLTTTWFERHGTKPTTDLPDPRYGQKYRDVVKRRIEVIQSNPEIALIEQPEYKRRWNTEPWDSQLQQAFKTWLLDRLETFFDFDGRMNEQGQPTAKLDVALTSVARLADVASHDPDFMQVGELYRDDPAFDVERLVADLVEGEHVPLLPVLRYKPSGLRKRAEWEKTWDLQRQEDAIDARTKLPSTDPQYLTEDQARELKRRQIGDIPVPPKYTSADFLKSDYWRLRGKLDVPKERWVSFPHCEAPDGSPVIAWAGYDHLQLARSVSAYYVEIQEHEGGHDDPRLVPLLACLIELLPWLKQWHNQVDPDFGIPMGDYFEGFIAEEARLHGLTAPEVRAWQPPKRTASRGNRKATT